MKDSNPYLSLSLALTSHALQELVPSAKLHSAFVAEGMFVLQFSSKDPINAGFRKHIQERVKTLSERFTLTEMVEKNARELLLSQGEKKLAHRLSPQGKGLISLLTIYGKTTLHQNELAETYLPTKLLFFYQNEGGEWCITGTVRKEENELNLLEKKVAQHPGDYFRIKGEKQGYFCVRNEGSYWLQNGLDAKESLQKLLRKLYNTIGVSQVQGMKIPDGATFQIHTASDELFPDFECSSDRAFLEHTLKSKEKLDTLLSGIYSYFEKNRLEPEYCIDGKPSKTLPHSFKKKLEITCEDILGNRMTLSEIRLEKLDGKNFIKINLVKSLERGVSLLLERDFSQKNHQK